MDKCKELVIRIIKDILSEIHNKTDPIIIKNLIMHYNLLDLKTIYLIGEIVKKYGNNQKDYLIYQKNMIIFNQEHNLKYFYKILNIHYINPNNNYY